MRLLLCANLFIVFFGISNGFGPQFNEDNANIGYNGDFWKPNIPDRVYQQPEFGNRGFPAGSWFGNQQFYRGLFEFFKKQIEEIEARSECGNGDPAINEQDSDDDDDDYEPEPEPISSSQPDTTQSSVGPEESTSEFEPIKTAVPDQPTNDNLPINTFEPVPFPPVTVSSVEPEPSTPVPNLSSTEPQPSAQPEPTPSPTSDPETVPLTGTVQPAARARLSRSKQAKHDVKSKSHSKSDKKQSRSKSEKAQKKHARSKSEKTQKKEAHSKSHSKSKAKNHSNKNHEKSQKSHSNKDQKEKSI